MTQKCHGLAFYQCQAQKFVWLLTYQELGYCKQLSWRWIKRMCTGFSCENNDRIGNTCPSSNPPWSRFITTQIKSAPMSLDNGPFTDSLIISHGISRFWNSVPVCCRTKSRDSTWWQRPPLVAPQTWNKMPWMDKQRDFNLNFQHPTQHPLACLVSWDVLNFWFSSQVPTADTLNAIKINFRGVGTFQL